MLNLLRLEIIFLFAFLMQVTVVNAYDQNLIMANCTKIHGKNIKRRDQCVTLEAINGAIIDDLRSGSESKSQLLLLELCRKESPKSYRKQVDCLNRAIDHIAKKQTNDFCENIRLNSGGSYQLKELCIQEETKARQRLGD